MLKNRKYRSAALRFGPALKAFLLCMFIGGSGIGYVWQQNQLFDLGKQIKQREQRLGELERQNEKLKKDLAYMHSPAYLDKRIKDLGLIQPLPSQIWRLTEPTPEQPASPQETRFAKNP